MISLLLFQLFFDRLVAQGGTTGHVGIAGIADWICRRLLLGYLLPGKWCLVARYLLIIGLDSFSGCGTAGASGADRVEISYDFDQWLVLEPLRVIFNLPITTHFKYVSPNFQK